MQKAPYRVLIVDEDVNQTRSAQRYLLEHAFHVATARSSAAAKIVLEKQAIELVLLDLGTVSDERLALCRSLAGPAGPAIILTVDADRQSEGVLGLELGADDCLARPFQNRELLARIKAVLRRRFPFPEHGRLYEAQGFVFDPAAHSIRAPSGALVPLTAAESAILNVLFQNTRRILSRSDIVDETQTAAKPAGRAIDLLISRLRRKLGAHGGRTLIKTRRGIGYLVDCEVAAS